MESKNYELYEAPATIVVTLQQEGVICASGTGGVSDYTWNDYEQE